MSTTNILDLNNRIDALEKIAHDVEPIQQQIDELKAWTDSGTKDATGNPIILTDGAAFKAVDLKVDFEPKQSGSGTPSPENVRPITGYTECVVDRDGKNLAYNNMQQSTVEMQGITWQKNSDGSITVSGTATGNSYILDAVRASVSSDLGKVTISGLSGVTNIRCETICLYDSNDNELYKVNNIVNDITIDLSLYSSANYIRIDYKRIDNGIVSGTIKPQIERGGSATPYVPYAHDNATIAFGQTVYGGSVDFKTGKVTVTHASIASYNGESINEPWLSSIDEYVSGATPTTGAQVVYPLTTPTELELTPDQLELLKGYNHISTNGDNIELTYQPDTLKADILLTVSQLYGSKISIMDGILAGGTTGQVLTKTSNDDYDATWATLPATRTTTKK